MYANLLHSPWKQKSDIEFSRLKTRAKTFPCSPLTLHIKFLAAKPFGLVIIKKSIINTPFPKN